MPYMGWINIQKMPEYRDAVTEVQRLIVAQVRPLTDALAQAGRDITNLEKEIADLKARLP